MISLTESDLRQALFEAYQAYTMESLNEIFERFVNKEIKLSTFKQGEDCECKDECTLEFGCNVSKKFFTE